MWRARKVADTVLNASVAYLKQSVRGAKSHVDKPNRDRYTVVLRKVRKSIFGSSLPEFPEAFYFTNFQVFEVLSAGRGRCGAGGRRPSSAAWLCQEHPHPIKEGCAWHNKEYRAVRTESAGKARSLVWQFRAFILHGLFNVDPVLPRQSSDIQQAHGVVEVAAEALDREVELVLKRLATHPVVCPASDQAYLKCSRL